MKAIQPWVEKVNRLKDNIRFWRYLSKKALDKDSKDRAIRQRHLWEMEYDYWYKKVNAFRMKEIKQGKDVELQSWGYFSSVGKTSLS